MNVEEKGSGKRKRTLRMFEDSAGFSELEKIFLERFRSFFPKMTV